MRSRTTTSVRVVLAPSLAGMNSASNRMAMLMMSELTKVFVTAFRLLSMMVVKKASSRHRFTA